MTYGLRPVQEKAALVSFGDLPVHDAGVRGTKDARPGPWHCCHSPWTLPPADPSVFPRPRRALQT